MIIEYGHYTFWFRFPRFGIIYKYDNYISSDTSYWTEPQIHDYKTEVTTKGIVIVQEKEQI